MILLFPDISSQPPPTPKKRKQKVNKLAIDTTSVL